MARALTTRIDIDMVRRALACALAIGIQLLCFEMAAVPADSLAAFPGRNGKIALRSSADDRSIPTMNATVAQSPEALYVALGDSVAAGPGTYVDLLFPYYRAALGVTRLSNRAVSGATSGSLRTGGQLDSAVADINAGTDTRAVTIDIGGNDRGECASRWDSCPFRDNFSATLYDLRAALREDPGAETFVAMAYYNPSSGLGGDEPFRGESWYDRQLLGSDLVVDCEILTGPQVGITDVIFQEAGRRGAQVADPYSAFKQGGQAFMADSIHPNDAGHAAIADAFREPKEGCAGLPDLPPPAPPSNDFQLGKVKRNKKRGTAKLTVTVPGPGDVGLAGTRRVRGARERSEAGEAVTVPIAPKPVTMTRLNRRGKARVRVEVSFRPDDGEPSTRAKRIKLRKRR